MKDKISSKRIAELERIERKMLALEAGGVDNWEWYDESLKQYRADSEQEELRAALLDELAEVFGACSYEPSERGAGISFSDDAFSSATGVLLQYGVTIKPQ